MHPIQRVLTLLAALALLGGCASLPPPPPRPVVNAALERRIDALVHGFDGKVGVAVEDVRTGAVVAVDGRSFYPQQSVSKLWVALAVLDAADHGALKLDEPILVRREDMSVFNQPIQKKLDDAGYPTTLDDLLGWAISRSDNAADDILMRRLGGQAAVARVIEAKGLRGLRASPEEHILESRVAGLEWRPEYSFGQAFWTARDKVDPVLRRRLLQAYVDRPEDGATPKGLVRALGRLQRGELLSPAATAKFMALLTATETGPLRLKAGLPPGWSIAHKTGTGQDLGDLSTGYNDVGLVTAPDGQVYAVAVMIAQTRRPIPERQALMAAVARAVAEAHETPLKEGLTHLRRPRA